MKRGLLAVAIAAAAMVATPPVMAQQAPGGGDGPRQRGEGGGRGNWDPAQMRQRMLENLKEQLQPSEEEWQVLQPKIEAVMAAQRNARTGGFGGRFGAGGGGRDRGGDQNETDVARAGRELRSVLDDANANEATINEKLNAYRAAREKADAELKAARDGLRDLITPRQEAVLVMYGMLE